MLAGWQGLSDIGTLTPIIDSNTTLVLQDATFYCNSLDEILGIGRIAMVYGAFDTVQVIASYGTWDVTLSGVVLQGHPIFNGGDPDHSVEFEHIGDITALDTPYIKQWSGKIVLISNTIG
jgi:hypothetical protein